ncbi:hypothetical protein NHX12_020449 [Muraenolepis orangiensis]|uniref:Thyroid transcription factor 1-associated protein 26 n=1 Tax=Muraenolepis orangiensis TaxID=630683 RepID=A0A9Q0ERG4_9TELE|nr:hypothetical protein NHX12_020449 [Muraenolepis orangiensis]
MNRGKYVPGQQRNSNRQTRGGPNKRKWIPDNKFYEGSVSEGQGFAFQRKTKVQHEYNKLLTKERRKNLPPKPKYTEEYPEHLRHLYMAESAKLKEEDLANKSKRTLSRMGGRQSTKTDEPGDADTGQQATGTEAPAVVPDVTASAAPEPGQEDPGQEDPEVKPGETPVAKEAEGEVCTEPAKPSLIIPMSNRMKKKLTRKTSYQIAQDECQEVNEQKRKKNEEILSIKKKKQDAVQKYKDKKKVMFQMLSRKTKKGQPNLNLQMEYLLQKIQGPPK